MSSQQHAPAALYPRERPGTHFTGGWVGPRAGLDGRKISSLPGFDPRPSSPQSVAIPTELPGRLRDMIMHNYGNNETNQYLLCSHFRYGIAICAPKEIIQRWKAFSVLGCCEVWVNSWLPTFRDNMSTPSSKEKMSKTV